MHTIYGGFPLPTPTVTIIVKIRQSALSQTRLSLILNNFMEIRHTDSSFDNNIFLRFTYFIDSRLLRN